MRRQQKNITVTKAEEDYIRQNYKSKTYKEMAAHLSLHQSKVIQNARVMGLVKEEVQEVPDFDKNGMFDTTSFFKCYAF